MQNDLCIRQKSNGVLSKAIRLYRSGDTGKKIEISLEVLNILVIAFWITAFTIWYQTGGLWK